MTSSAQKRVSADHVDRHCRGRADLCVIAVVLALRSFDRSQYHGDIEYWRDEPEMSPASAAELLYIVDNKHSKTLSSRKMSASVLSLASRGAIAIYPGAACHVSGH